MKGTDVSAEELRTARTFLEHISHADLGDSEKMMQISQGQLIRIVAWYGAIRSDGDGSGQIWANGKPLKQPGATEVQG